MKKKILYSTIGLPLFTVTAHVIFQGPAAVILDIYKNGAIDKDGRLEVGDLITECNGVAITKEMAHERVCLTIKRRAQKVGILLYRVRQIQSQCLIC